MVNSKIRVPEEIIKTNKVNHRYPARAEQIFKMSLGSLFHASDLPRDGQHCLRLSWPGEEGEDWTFVWKPADVCTEGEATSIWKDLLGPHVQDPASDLWKGQLFELLDFREESEITLYLGWNLVWQSPLLLSNVGGVRRSTSLPSFGWKTGSEGGD